MFCPECRCEYRPGFHQCADCGLALVEKLPEPDPPAPAHTMTDPLERNRTDSRNIAFIKGAFIGFACAEVLTILAGMVLQRYLLPTAVMSSPPPDWLGLVAPLTSMFRPLGILIGGYVARSRVR